VLHATALRIPVVEVEGGTLTALCGFDGHQGVALVVEPRRWATIDDVLSLARSRGEPPFVLMLDSLEDPQNVGTLLRSAEACGVHGVLFPTRRSAPISPAAVKASAGAVEHLLLVPLDDLAHGLVDLHAQGLRLVGADESAALSFREADLRGPLALVVGSEGHGISGILRRRIDLSVRIPMRGKVGSLNAAVAGSVLLFEASAQRGDSPSEPEGIAADVFPHAGFEHGVGDTGEALGSEGAMASIDALASALDMASGFETASELVAIAADGATVAFDMAVTPPTEPVPVAAVARPAKSAGTQRKPRAAAAATGESAAEGPGDLPTPKPRRTRGRTAANGPVPTNRAAPDDLLPS